MKVKNSSSLLNIRRIIHRTMCMSEEENDSSRYAFGNSLNLF